jgi:hypothetical protein
MIRIVLFCLFSYAMIIGFYKLYRKLNDKIMGSHTLFQLIGFALLLILANSLLFVGGLFVFFKVYAYLTV